MSEHIAHGLTLMDGADGFCEERSGGDDLDLGGATEHVGIIDGIGSDKLLLRELIVLLGFATLPPKRRLLHTSMCACGSIGRKNTT